MTPRTPEPPDFPASQLFLRRLAFSLVRDEARAEDLVQDTWAAWVEHRPSGIAEPRAWLARVLRNRAFNAKRSERRRAEREELAGRPDPSMPETDGTLEAQSQLLEALRKLEEPYRSTLVERYYHDLSPTEIAARSGTPLNTIKARLLRGLTKLREEMDRRYGGDRSAWCHWLTVLSAPAVPIAVPHPTAGAPQGAAPFAGMGGGGGMSLLGWLALAGVAAVGAVLKMEWGRAPRVEKQAADERQASVPVRETIESGGRGRVPVPTEDPVPRAERPASRPADRPALQAPPLVPAEVVRLGSARGETFDWPQYGGGPEHDNYRQREDEISAPRVLWFVPGCAGQPTLEGGSLYTGGLTVARLDPDTGEPEGLSLELLSEALQVELDPRKWDEDKALALIEKMKAFDPNDPSFHTVAAAPVITRDLVLARRARDGGVEAFDRELGAGTSQPTKEVWRWDSGWQDTQDLPSSRVPLCLTDGGIVLVALHNQLIALRVANGREVWRYRVNGRIEMVPAAAGDRVFFGTDRGLFVALSASTGEELWKVGADGFGASSPVVQRWRVLVADQAGLPWSTGPSSGVSLRAYNVASGVEVWRTAFEGSRLTDLGLGQRGDYAVVGFGQEVARFELSAGKRDRRNRIRIGSELRCAPAIVGESLVLGCADGRLSVHELESEHQLRWTFQLPDGAEIDAFVHTGKRIYVATSIGLFCIADDPTRAAPAPGFVLGWDGNPRVPSYLDEDMAGLLK